MKKIFTILALLYAVVVYSQWNTNVEENLQISSLKSSVDYTAKTSDGKTYVFFLEENSTSNYVPRVQLLDKDGNKLFGEDGIVVNSTAKFSTYVQVSDCVIDADNNLIVSFYATGESKLYANKITPEGVNVWGDAGIVVSTGALAKILPLSSGVVIGYILSGKGNLMKFDSNTGVALWSSAVVLTSPVSTLPYTSVTELSKLSDDSFVSVYIGKGTSYGVYGALFAQRFDGSGNAVWSSPVRMTSTTGVQYNVRYDHVVDGDNLYFPYFTSGINGSKFDAFVQKIGSDGSLPWGENGKDISTGTYFETKTNIGIFGDYVWAISTFTNSTQGPRGEFAQKINKNTGDILFGESAKQVYPLASGPGAPTHMSSIEFLGTTPVFVTADNTITSSALALGAVTLDDSGNILSEKVLSGASVKSNINVISDGEQLIAVWGDARENSTPRMYAQNYKLDATLATQDASFSLDYKIYPNPVVSNINILTSKKIRQVSIYDTNGRNILNSKEKTFSLEKLGSAIYILKTIFEDGKTVSNKIIKK